MSIHPNLRNIILVATQSAHETKDVCSVNMMPNNRQLVQSVTL